MVAQTQLHIDCNTFPTTFNKLNIPRVQHSKGTDVKTVTDFETQQQNVIDRCKRDLLRNELTLHQQRLQEETVELNTYTNPNSLRVTLMNKYPTMHQTDANFIMRASNLFSNLWSQFIDKIRLKKEDKTATIATMEVTTETTTKEKDLEAEVSLLRKELDKVKAMLKPERPQDHRGRGRDTTRGSKKSEKFPANQDQKQSRSQSTPRNQQRDGGAHDSGNQSHEKKKKKKKNRKPRSKSRAPSTRSPSRDSRQ